MIRETRRISWQPGSGAVFELGPLNNAAPAQPPFPPAARAASSTCPRPRTACNGYGHEYLASSPCPISPRRKSGDETTARRGRATRTDCMPRVPPLAPLLPIPPHITPSLYYIHVPYSHLRAFRSRAPSGRPVHARALLCTHASNSACVRTCAKGQPRARTNARPGRPHACADEVASFESAHFLRRTAATI